MSTLAPSAEYFLDRLWVLSCAENAQTGLSERVLESIEASLNCSRMDLLALRRYVELLDDKMLEVLINVPNIIWLKKQIRLNTRDSYTLTKYGLLIEELEGYSGLLSVLSRISRYDLLNVDVSLFGVQTLLGTYDFDPIRLYDLQVASKAKTSRFSNEKTVSLHGAVRLDPAQLSGFRFQRSFKTSDIRISKFASIVGSALLNKGVSRVESLIPHLWNDGDTVCKGISSAAEQFKLVNQTLQFIEVACTQIDDNSALMLLERCARLGCRVYENRRIREFLLKKLELSINTFAHHGNILQVAALAGPVIICDVKLYLSLVSLLNTAKIHELQLHSARAVLSSCILPGIYFKKPNPLLSSQVWEVLQTFSFSMRAKVYEHSAHSIRDCPSLSRFASRASRATHRVLRRLSTENLKHLGRKLGKIMSRYPFTAVDIVIEQIQAYPHMISAVVESLKYSSALSLDILAHTLIVRLSSENDKLKSDGQHVALWFSSLCTFAGSLYKTLPCLDLSAIMQYILKALKNGQTMDLLILKELISQLTGIEVLQEASETQRLIACAGEKLRAYKQQAPRSQANVKRVARFRESLKTKDFKDDATVALLVLISKCRTNIVTGNYGTQLKFVSQWHDECHNILLQYISFLQVAYTDEEYSRLFPSIRKLFGEYDLDLSVVFHLYRPILKNLYRCIYLDQITPTGSNHGASWHALLDDVRGMLPNEVWEAVSPEFCLEFWTLNLSDIFVPELIYESTIAKCEQNLTESKELWAQGLKAAPQLEIRTAELVATIDSLRVEYAELSLTVRLNSERLSKSMISWVAGANRSKVAFIILQYLVFPRSKLSHEDATYVAKFVNLMHFIHVPGFSTLQYHDTLFRDFAQLVYSCSERESTHFGEFMLETLRQLSRWRAPDVYASECAGFDGFRIHAHVAKSNQEHSDFLKICHKWQHRLAKALLARLGGSDYMELRNVLSVLVSLISQFPLLTSHGRHFYKHVEQIIAKDRRCDITTVAKRYLAMLKNAQPQWENDAQFI